MIARAMAEKRRPVRGSRRAQAKLLSNSDYRHHAAGEVFAAVAEKQIGAAESTEFGDEDVFRRDARFRKHSSISSLQIELAARRRRLVAGRHHGEPRKWIRIFAGSEGVEGTFKPRARLRKLRGEFLDNVGTDFITALTDARADGGENVGRSRREFHLHAAQRFCGDARDCAAPSGVNGGDGAMTRIDEQNGNAVGGLNREKQAGRAGGEGVAFSGIVGLGGSRGDDVCDVGMDLAQCDERKFRIAKRFGEAAAVFVNAFATVPFGVAEIQEFSLARLIGARPGSRRFENADTASASAEAVNEPVELREGSKFENFQARCGTETPRRFKPFFWGAASASWRFEFGG